jgi:hypothetical protein
MEKSGSYILTIKARQRNSSFPSSPSPDATYLAATTVIPELPVYSAKPIGQERLKR